MRSFHYLDIPVMATIENRKNDIPLPSHLHDRATSSIRAPNNSYCATFRDATLVPYPGNQVKCGQAAGYMLTYAAYGL